MLLAALYRQYIYNPIEYIYSSLNARISLLTKSDLEFDLIREYCYTTVTSTIKKLKIFKIERKGEPEGF